MRVIERCCTSGSCTSCRTSSITLKVMSHPTIVLGGHVIGIKYAFAPSRFQNLSATGDFERFFIHTKNRIQPDHEGLRICLMRLMRDALTGATLTCILISYSYHNPRVRTGPISGTVVHRWKQDTIFRATKGNILYGPLLHLNYRL